jgi:hypothetical protein
LDQLLHRGTHGTGFPVGHVFCLVAARDEQRFCLADGIGNEGIIRRRRARNAQCGDGILTTEFLDVRVIVGIVVVLTRGEDEEIATSGFVTEKLEGRFLIGSAAHKRIAGARFRGHILRIADPRVLIGRSSGEEGGGKDTKQQEEFGTKTGHGRHYARSPGNRKTGYPDGS